jgi:hypothetical protein
MNYTTRGDHDPVTPADLQTRWSEVDAWRVVQAALTRDSVALRRQAREGADVTLELAAHDVALTLAGAKLARAMLAYYEARDALEHQARGEMHSH